MTTTQEAGQHMVLFVAAGDGSDAACEAVARRLSEKFGTPFEKMLASVRQSPRVFKRNLSPEQAESYAAMLRGMGAVAEVQSGAASDEPKPPPPEVTDRTCPFCGRALQADGVCVICKPREVAPPAAEALPEHDPEPDIQPQPEDPGPVLHTGVDFQDAATPGSAPAIPAGNEWTAPSAAAGTSPPEASGGQGKSLDAGCANCGGLLNRDGICPACDLGAVDPADESAAIENDLSALLSPEELGVCPNCCGPMEQDGTCLICPPAEPAVSPAAAPPAEAAFPVAVPPEAPGEFPLDDPLDAAALLHTGESPGSDEALPGPAREQDASPFEPLAPLNMEPEMDGAHVCPRCGGPQGSDGTCLICGDDNAVAIPEFEEMPVTGNEPPPSEAAAPEEAADPAAAEAAESGERAEPDKGKSPGRKISDRAPAPGKKQKVNLDLARFPRALAIPLLATLALLIGGITMAMGGSFVVASGLWFLALIAGLVTVFKGIRHLEGTVSRFPKLPKPVIFAFILFLFIVGSGSIAGYAFKQSAIFLLDQAGKEIQAELDRLPGEEGLPGVTGAEAAEALESEAGGGQIIMEEAMLERAVSAELEGEENPRAALENWSAYLEGFPDGTRAPEARRKVSHWKAVVTREDALAAANARDRKGNNDPAARISDWRSCLAAYGNTPAIRDHAEQRIGFWESMQQQSATPNFPYWASLRLDDGRTFSGKVIAENDQELKMELPNRLKMKFGKDEYELIESDHINGKRVEGENMRLVSGVTTERPTWGHEDGITIIGEDRAGVESMVSFRVTGFYHIEVMARATRDHGGFPSVILSLNGTQQERIRFDSEDWKLYKVAFPFRIPAGERRLEIVFPPQYQTMQDKRTVAIDYFTTAMVE